MNINTFRVLELNNQNINVYLKNWYYPLRKFFLKFDNFYAKFEFDRIIG